MLNPITKRAWSKPAHLLRSGVRRSLCDIFLEDLALSREKLARIGMTALFPFENATRAN